MTQPLVSLRGVRVTYPDAPRPAIRDLSLDVRAGEVVLVAGPSGSGKSTLALTMNGLIPHAVDADLEGVVTVGGEDAAAATPARLSETVAMVFQDPDAQVVTGTLFDEVAFALENLLLPVAEIERRAERALRRMGLWGRRAEDPAALSGGGRQRLAIACALAMDASVIVLDEPTANLDPSGVRDVYDALGDVAAAGDRALVLVEHDLARASRIATRMVVLDGDGSLAFDDEPAALLRDRRDELAALGVALAPAATDSPARAASDPVVTVRDLTISRGGRDVLRGISADVPRGGFTAIVGPNGAGKTTLAQAVAGVIPAPRGSVRVDGRDPWRERAPAAFVFQNPEHQFVTHTVRDELAHSLRRSRLPHEEVDARVVEMLDRFGLSELADQHPFRLSGGQKRRLSVGTALIGMRPGGVLVLDEPLYGQDRGRADALLAMLEELHAAGTTIVVVTHDEGLVARHATHVIEVPAGADPPPPPARPRPRALERLNPLAKLAAVVPAMIGLVFTRDALTPALFLALTYAALVAGARPTRRLALWLAAILPATALVLAGGFTLWSGPEAGIATGLRLAALLALALIPGLTSEGVDTVRALVTQLRIPYRIGYSALAALRFVPRFRFELAVIRAAHRVRGSGVRGPLASARLLVPLLASGIRHAERVALAMDARAFGAHATRTERHQVPWRRRDTWCVATGLALTAAAFVAGAIL
ncbi:MAG TPA: ATP-binding cassette domain-containing protein [Microbacterium sp.]|nr:ATP-binding cassette domain-containing protein [Microbacterium sp.]